VIDTHGSGEIKEQCKLLYTLKKYLLETIQLLSKSRYANILEELSTKGF
jgi:hypothetical protein